MVLVLPVEVSLCIQKISVQPLGEKHKRLKLRLLVY